MHFLSFVKEKADLEFFYTIIKRKITVKNEKRFDEESGVLYVNECLRVLWGFVL